MFARRDFTLAECAPLYTHRSLRLLAAVLSVISAPDAAIMLTRTSAAGVQYH
jgi:hypothetical protein